MWFTMIIDIINIALPKLLAMLKRLSYIYIYIYSNTNIGQHMFSQEKTNRLFTNWMINLDIIIINLSNRLMKYIGIRHQSKLNICIYVVFSVFS